MKKDDFLMAGALFLIALMVAGVHMATDHAIAEAVNTGNAALLSSAESWQMFIASLEILMVIGIIIGIKRDISRNARIAR